MLLSILAAEMAGSVSSAKPKTSVRFGAVG